MGKVLHAFFTRFSFFFFRGWASYESHSPFVESTKHGTLDFTTDPMEILRRCGHYAMYNAERHQACEAMCAADRRAAGEEEDEEWEDVDEEISSRPPTPLSRSPSPLADAPSSRAPSPELESGRSSPLLDIPPSRLPSPARPSPFVAANHLSIQNNVDSWKLRQKGGKKKRQQRARQKAAQAVPFGPPPKVIHSQAHREQPRHETTFNAKDVRAVSGAWTGLRATKRPRTRKLRHRRKWSLRALEEDDCEVIEWNGRPRITSSDPKVIVDAEGRIIAVLLGRPEGDDWDEVIKKMEHLMKALRRRGRKLGIFSAKKESHRRGKFNILNDALTMGPGQRRPGNLLRSSREKNPSSG
ncbi:hypothetical protein B0H14DRAFT_3174164 [Mycena olivaceomarginata]|nr:hypothetical protein B0H14DRAFT_3174164 [Mycena olivaceomarginata]